MSILVKKVDTNYVDRTTRRLVDKRTFLIDRFGELLRSILLFPILWIFTRPRIRGIEHLAGQGPYIFAANHASHLDAPLLLAALPLRLRLRVAAAADYFFTRRWKGMLVRILFNAFPFERKGIGSAASLIYAQQLLNNGYSILLFPEGTRTRDGHLQPFKRGIGRLALATSTAVIPIRIDGTYDALPKGSWLPCICRVTITFGAPLTFSPDSDLLSTVAVIEQQVRSLAPSASSLSSHAFMAIRIANEREREHKSMATTTREQKKKRYGGIYAIKPWWQRRLARLEDVLVKHHVHPDVITASGVVFAGLLGLALVLSGQWAICALAVAPLAIGRLAANALDGLVARRSGLAHPRGEVFNECCDRLSDILVFAGLAFNGHVIAPLAWSALVLALLSSYVGIASKAAGGHRQFGGFLAKADRMIYLALFSPLVLAFGPTAWNWLLLAFLPALLVTLVQRYRWTYSDLKQVEERS